MAKLYVENYFTTTLQTTVSDSIFWEIEFQLWKEPKWDFGFLIIDYADENLREEIKYHRKSWTSVFVYWIRRTNPKPHWINALVQMNDSASIFNYITDILPDHFYAYQISDTSINIKWGKIFDNWEYKVIPWREDLTFQPWTNYLYVEEWVIETTIIAPTDKLIVWDIQVNTNWIITDINNYNTLATITHRTNKILRGNTVPTSSTGIDWDYYIDDTNKKFHWPKVNWIWDSGFSLISLPSLDWYQLKSEKWSANWYAALDWTGKVPSWQLPNYTAPEDLDNYQLKSEKWQANWYVWLDWTGKVPASNLPSFVDEILEYADKPSFPASGTTWVLYVALDENQLYRWSGSQYVQVAANAGSTNFDEILWDARTNQSIADYLDWKVWVNEDLVIKKNIPRVQLFDTSLWGNSYWDIINVLWEIVFKRYWADMMSMSTNWELQLKKGWVILNDTADMWSAPENLTTKQYVDWFLKSDPTWVTWADQITNIMSLTQAEYDAIANKDLNTLYVITE